MLDSIREKEKGLVRGSLLEILHSQGPETMRLISINHGPVYLCVSWPSPSRQPSQLNSSLEYLELAGRGGAALYFF